MGENKRLADTLAWYRVEARRTQRVDIGAEWRQTHALLGLGAEMEEVVAEIENGNPDGVRDELGDLMWMVAELCDNSGCGDIDISGDCAGDIEAMRGWMRCELLQNARREVGRILGIYQKALQGHRLDADVVRYSVIALVEYAAQIAVDYGAYTSADRAADALEDVLRRNIEKLRARYPHGFSVERSEHREA